MPTLSAQTIIERYSHLLSEHADQLTAIQHNLMDARRQELNLLREAIAANIRLSDSTQEFDKRALYDHAWLKEFALGDITRCLGPEFHIYTGRKSPRIPNGDLLLMSRIVDIHGVRGDFENRAKITTEFDVPLDTWFFVSQRNGAIPLSMLMEIALQPCGVLSAWMHTQLKFPAIDFSFRNLDGSIQILEHMNFRGKTITCQSVLEKTIFSGSTIIQHFSFELSCDGRAFLNGLTTFGYFPVEMMVSQIGLDSGMKTEPWGNLPQNVRVLTNPVVSPSLRKDEKLRLIDTIRSVKQTREKPFGYILAERKNEASDWYYNNHFLDDPVMPGSLGIEMIVQAVLSALPTILPESVEYEHAFEQGLQWKYRGQVLPHNANVLVDVTVVDNVIHPDFVSFVTNANLWADNLRIYEITGLTFTLHRKGM